MVANPNAGAGDRYAMKCMEIRGGSNFVEESLTMPGLDAWVYSLPYEGAEHGGDLYYLSLCGGGIVTRVVVADVSGHGATVADFSSALRSLMHKNINTKSQTRLVTALNQQFAEATQSRRFATAIIATYLAHRQKLTICNAGHPLPIWFRASDRSWKFLDRDDEGPGNLPLGIDEESPYRQFSVTLGQGDILFFYTDALVEALDGAGQLLGQEGLLNAARGLDANDPARVGPALLEAVANYRGGRAADDDVTLLMLHHNAEGPRKRSLGERIDVYAKVFGLRPY